LPIFLFLAVAPAFSANRVWMEQIRSVEACEEDGKGKIQVVVYVGEIKESDSFQSYEIAVSYKDQPLRITLPELTVNTLTEQMPKLYRSFSTDDEFGEFFGSAALITAGEAGVSGSQPLIGFWVDDESECDELAELRITQFFVNEECKVSFDIDSTLSIEKKTSEKFISDLSISSQISSLTLATNNISDTLWIDMNMDSYREIEKAVLTVEAEGNLSVEFFQLHKAESTQVEGSSIEYTGLTLSDNVSDKRLGALYTYTGSETEHDTMYLNASLQITDPCGCVNLLDAVTNDKVVFVPEPKSISAEFEKPLFWYTDRLVSNGYKGPLTIVSTLGQSIQLKNYEDKEIVLTNGFYLIVTPDNRTQKIIVNNF